MMNTDFKYDPHWITGFTDAEGCFHVSIYKSNLNNKLKWRIGAFFQLHLHIKDLNLLIDIKSFFNTGNIYIKKNSVSYIVKDINSIINIIIPHFDNYPLITQKQSDFVLFKNIIELMKNKEHLTKEGLGKIINLKASLNNGIPKNLTGDFPIKKIIPKVKVLSPKTIDYNWLAGFFSGDGCFYVAISKRKASDLGCRVDLIITITQHSKDKLLMNKIAEILKCGSVYIHSSTAVVLKVSEFKAIKDIIIPLFKKYPIKGVKSKDFEDFCLISEMIQDKVHLTLKGFEEIKRLKKGMNKGRN